MNADGSIILGPGELAVLATLLIADRLSDPGEWASWDMVPGLDEDCHHALLGVIEAAWRDEARRLGPDAAEILRRVS